MMNHTNDEPQDTIEATVKEKSVIKNAKRDKTYNTEYLLM